MEEIVRLLLEKHLELVERVVRLEVEVAMLKSTYPQPENPYGTVISSNVADAWLGALRDNTCNLNDVVRGRKWDSK